MRAEDTICALATPPGRGALAVVRVSGARAEELLRALFVPAAKIDQFESHKLYYGHAVYAGETLDECMAVFMRAPRSYTREDSAEFQLHGGEEAPGAVLRALCELGARPAQPGEFTRRAFLNGRVDLSRAEAVMALIESRGRQAARAALRQLSGGAGSFIRKAQEDLLALMSGVTAALDFPDEIDENEAAGDTALGALSLAETLESACDERAARMLDSGLDVVICGAPNVGKSSLLNALTGEDRALVTAYPGTTRDVVRESVYINGLRVNLSDTAGIRDTAEPVEALGVSRAEKAMENGDLVLLAFDGSRDMTGDERALLARAEDKPHILLINKTDLPQILDLPGALPVCALTGEGLSELRARIAAFAGAPSENALTSLRHIRLARLAAASLRLAAQTLQSGELLDLCSLHLEEALNALGEITGDRVDEKLLDSVFSRFCVGK